MKKVRIAVAMMAVLGASMASIADADARGRHHHRHSGVRFGLFIGAPIIPYYYSRYHYPPSYYSYPYHSYPYYPQPVAPSAPVYMEQGAQAPAESQVAYWYFCRDSQTYYPYVQNCATPWQQVVPQSAPPS